MMAMDGLAAIVVMGVSGSGKSTVAEALARRAGLTFRDGDGFHPAANIAKMRAGIPLTDADRAPWLAAIAQAIDDAADRKAAMVVACSALKRAYRDVLVHGRRDVAIVYLKGTPALITQRLAKRHGHFMPAALLDSQLATLEEPGDDEPAVTIDIDRPINMIVDDIIARLGLAPNEASP
ncbi:MAG: gluconokinase [Xanthobacteraceae bacterium]|nr:gluconokinase [Xanthobacteraceae bacterium]